MTDRATTLTDRYHAMSAADAYIIGFPRHGKVYAVRVSFNELCTCLRESRKSSARGGAYQLRVYIPSVEMMKFIATGRATAIADESELDATFNGKKLNKGDAFEKLVTEKLAGKNWEGHNSVPFYKAGDVNINGEEIQVKFQNAELTNEDTMARAEALA